MILQQFNTMLVSDEHNKDDYLDNINEQCMFLLMQFLGNTQTKI